MELCARHAALCCSPAAVRLLRWARQGPFERVSRDLTQGSMRTQADRAAAEEAAQKLDAQLHAAARQAERAAAEAASALQQQGASAAAQHEALVVRALPRERPGQHCT